MNEVQHTNCRVVITGLRGGPELTADQCQEIVVLLNRHLTLDVPVYVVFESDVRAVGGAQ